MPTDNGQRQPSQMKPRTWEEHYEPIADEGELLGFDREEMRSAFAEVEGIIFRLGGAFIIMADRRQLEDGSYVTVGARFEYQPFVPARPAGDPNLETNMGNPAVSQHVRGDRPPPHEPEPAEPTPAPPPAAEEEAPEPAPAAEYQPGPGEDGPPPVSAAAGTQPEPAAATLE